MKIVFFVLLLFCNQALFANFSAPQQTQTANFHLSQIADNQVLEKFSLPLLPIEPTKSKPKKNKKSIELMNPFIGAMWVLILGIVGMICFGIGFNNGLIWLWSLGIGLEFSAVLIGVSHSIIEYISYKPSRGEWIKIGSFYAVYLLSLFIFLLAKAIQFFLMSVAFAIPLFSTLGIAVAATSLISLIFFLADR